MGKDIINEIKDLDNNILNAVSREDGTLEVHLKKHIEQTKAKVITFLNSRCLNTCFVRIDFHELEARK